MMPLSRQELSDIAEILLFAGDCSESTTIGTRKKVYRITYDLGIGGLMTGREATASAAPVMENLIDGGVLEEIDEAMWYINGHNEETKQDKR